MQLRRTHLLRRLDNRDIGYRSALGSKADSRHNIKRAPSTEAKKRPTGELSFQGGFDGTRPWSPTQYVKPPVSHPVSSKRQSRQDLAPVKAGERISDCSEERLASATETGKGYGVGATFPRLASATHISARAGLGEIKGKTPRHFGRGPGSVPGLLPKLGRR